MNEEYIKKLQEAQRKAVSSAKNASNADNIRNQIETKVAVSSELVAEKIRGVAVFVSATQPSNPQTNDIWIKI